MPKYGRIRLFAGFETDITAFAVQFLEVWSLFWVDWRYRCKHTGENVYSPGSKPVLRHSQFYFQNIGGYFESIVGTVAIILAKMFIRRFRNRFYGICCSIFKTFEVILSRSKIPLSRYGRKRSFPGFDTIFTAFADLFLKHWSLFWVNPSFRCQDTGENVHSPDSIPYLRHLLFYFSNFGCYFDSIFGTYALILAKTFIRPLQNQF